jgi:hypothetical protein
MDIILNDKYKITSDKYNYILQEKRQPNPNHHKTKNQNEVRWVDLGYYGKYSDLINALIEKEIKTSDVKNFNEIKILIESVARDISSKLESISV